MKRYQIRRSISDTGYLAKQESNQASTAETEYHDDSMLPLVCSLSAVFFSWILLTLLAALACLFVLQETDKFLERGSES